MTDKSNLTFCVEVNNTFYKEMIPAQTPTEHYNLRWNNYTTNLMGVFSDLYTNESLTDVTLLCENEEIKAHRIILSASSIYFKNLFEKCTHHNPYIIMHDIKLKYLKLIIQFMYSGETKVVNCDLHELLHLGGNLQVKGLSSIQVKEPENTKEMGEKNENPTRKKRKSPETDTGSTSTEEIDSECLEKPANAFMIFAREWRDKIAKDNPNMSNKDISVHLGQLWKTKPFRIKKLYYQKARELENDDQKKFKSEITEDTSSENTER